MLPSEHCTLHQQHNLSPAENNLNVHPMLTRSKTGTIRTKIPFAGMLTGSKTLSTVVEALANPIWYNAM